MLKLIGLVFKLTLFTAFVLVLGHLIQWNGRSISDQVKTTLSSVERNPSLKKVKRTGTEIIEDASDVIQEQASSLKRKGASLGGSDSPAISDSIPHEEREELNALLDENP